MFSNSKPFKNQGLKGARLNLQLPVAALPFARRRSGIGSARIMVVGRDYGEVVRGLPDHEPATA
jgi:hypothetical protein